MKINKIICDKCQKEIDTDSEIRLDIMKKEKTSNGFSLGFKKQGQIDLCQECYKRIFGD